MRNIKLVLEYDGSRYQGWQRLGKEESTNTISNKIIDVLHKMTGETIELFCGSRTEVGVHAYGQVANFKTSSNMTLLQMKQYLNRYLPTDIAVIDIEEVPERFHSALNAKSKVYTYRIAVNDLPSVFERKYVYHVFKTPDTDAMRSAALLLVGKHDFKGFSSAKKNKSTEKEIYDIDIYQAGNEVQISIHANDFLHNMVRILLGTLLDIGLGNRKKEEIELIFSGQETASAPVDAKGLYLQEVLYN